ncbi:MAG: N-acetyltransferase family protein [Thermoplasmatota archaeon]
MDLSVTVTKARKSDLPAVRRAFLEVLRSIPYYNEWAKTDERAKYTLKNLQEKLRKDADSILVARDRSSIAGFSFTTWDDGLVWINWFGVSPSHRGRGTGSLLLDATVSLARERRAIKVWCDSRTENLESIQCLRKSGFRRLARLDLHWYGQDFFLWEKRL